MTDQKILDASSASLLSGGLATALKTGKEITLTPKEVKQFYAAFRADIEPSIKHIRQENITGYARTILLMLD